jgi:hypothetical protein
MVDLVWRQARDDIVAVGEQQADEAHGQRGQRGGQEPCTWGVVGGCGRRGGCVLVSHGCALGEEEESITIFGVSTVGESYFRAEHRAMACWEACLSCAPVLCAVG